MRKRYFVTYRIQNGESSESVTRMIGRFWDTERADDFVRLHFAGKEFEIAEVRPETPMESALHRVERFFIRTFRILVGCILGLVAYAYVSSHGVDTADIPLGSLTPRMIGDNLLNVGIMIGAIWACSSVAFGKGPDS